MALAVFKDDLYNPNQPGRFLVRTRLVCKSSFNNGWAETASPLSCALKFEKGRRSSFPVPHRVRFYNENSVDPILNAGHKQTGRQEPWPETHDRRLDVTHQDVAFGVMDAGLYKGLLPGFS